MVRRRRLRSVMDGHCCGKIYFRTFHRNVSTPFCPHNISPMRSVSHILSLTLAAIAGGLLGAILTSYIILTPQPVTMIEDSGTDIPVVRIEGIENGALQGTAEGNVRVVAGEEIVMPDDEGRFSIEDRALLINRITVQAPPGMQFVASSKGTKYYAIDSSAGQNIVPANRVYFATAQEAEAAGYKK